MVKDDMKAKINNMSLYFTLFTIRQLFYFTKGRDSFTKFGKRAITEHFEWKIKNNIELIINYVRCDNKTGILTNLTNGGEGLSGYIQSTELREYRSNLLKGDGNGMYNKKHTIESRNKMTETRLHGYKSGDIKPTIHSEEYKRNLSERLTKKVDEESIIRLNSIGYSVNEIVRETGIDRDIIRRRLKKYNLSINSKKEKKVDMNEINNMLINNIDKSIICAEFNISLTTLNRKIKKYKLI